MSFRRGARRPDGWPTIHDRARAALSAQMDGELDAPEAAWLQDHLAGCPDCRRTADEYAAQRFELRRLRDHQPLPPRDLWARTAAAIELEAGGRSGRARSSARRSFVLPSAFIATALAVVVATGLLTSSRLPGRVDDGSGSVPPEVALASGSAAAGGGSATPRETPIIVAQRTVDFVARGPEGKLQVKSTTVHEVCPSGSSEPCDTGEPVQDHSVTIDQHAQAVFGDGDEGKRLIVVSSPSADDPGTIAVVSLDADTVAPSPSPAPPSVPGSASPSPSASASTSGGPTPSASPTSSPTPTASPTASTRATPSATPLVTASPTGSIDVTPPSGETREIAHDVALVGQTAAYSESGTWFAFTARPIDGSAGPDIYLWHVGADRAERVTTDGRSVFGSWVGDTIVGSRAIDATAGGGTTAATGLKAESFLLDPATSAPTLLPQTGSAWRPVVDPSGRKAVYWTGTLRSVAGAGFAPASGRLVIGDWGIESPAPSGSSTPAVPSDDQAKTRHETTIGAGQIDDWDARWDQSGTHLAVWIADHQNPAVGRLSLYAVSSFDGSIDLKDPLLESRRAAAGFSLSNDGLIWAEPSSDPNATEGSIHLLAWTDQGNGTVSTLSGPAIVIR
jgi:anti-sigma factor RsiW